MKLGILATHPIQYHAPLYRELAKHVDLHVYFAHQQTASGQADSGFGVAFEWDVDLLSGYPHSFLTNQAKHPSTDSFKGTNTPEIRDIIRRERFDAFFVTGWYTRSFWQAMMACWRTKTPLLIRGDSQLGTPRSRLLQLVKEAAYRAFIPRFDRYLVVGERAKEYYLHYGAAPSRMHFVPHYVDNAFFRHHAEAADQGRPLRASLGYTDDTLVLLFVGKFISKKRPFALVEAVSRLRQLSHDARALFVGSGELEEQLRTAVQTTGIPAEFAGFKNQTEVPAYYAAADLLVLPSDGGETWGLVVNEAMACGTPAAVSDAAGCAPDLIDPGETGVRFPLDDPEALATAIDGFVPSLRSDRVKHAIQTKIDRYSLSVATQGVLEAIRASSGGPHS
ncbi:MAG: hypothetical protein Rubg2KO_27300 [Rubricoccaceae bacterium]